MSEGSIPNSKAPEVVRASTGVQPPTGRRGIAAWLELVRAGNLPTTLSNALVGWAIATQAAPDHRFLLAALAVAALYAAGMIFNDVCDARIDARERPGRPIPSGRIESRHATIAVGVLFASALGLLAFTTHAAVSAGGVLIAAIAAYDLLHTRSAAAVLLMAACRMMVYVVVGSAAPLPGGWPLPMPTTAIFAGALGAYIVGLSVVARLETSTSPGTSPGTTPGTTPGTSTTLGSLRRAAPFLLLVPPFIPLFAGLPRPWWLPLLALPTVVWILLGVRQVLARPPRRAAAVAIWIAGIPLVDALFLGVLDRPALACIAVACWLVTVMGQRRLAAT